MGLFSFAQVVSVVSVSAAPVRQLYLELYEGFSVKAGNLRGLKASDWRALARRFDFLRETSNFPYYYSTTLKYEIVKARAL
jgi:hypothetical protein